MTIKSIALIVALGTAVACGARAGIIYDNLGATTSGADPVGAFGPLADSFTTPGQAIPVVTVEFLLEGDPESGGSFQISLLADDAGAPGSVITSSGALSDSYLNTTFTPFGGTCTCDLAPDTRYWVQIADAGGTSAYWAWSLDTSGPGVAGEFFANANGVFPNVDGPYQMEIAAGAPEPAGWALMLVGLGGLGAALRSRPGTVAQTV